MKNIIFRAPAEILVSYRQKRPPVCESAYINRIQHILKDQGLLHQDEHGMKRYHISVKGERIADELIALMKLMGIKKEDLNFSRSRKKIEKSLDNFRRMRERKN